LKRLRLLIYESDTPEHLEKTLGNSVQGTQVRSGMKITAIDLDPLRITILQLLRLFTRETK
jgi:hypothetical protein